MARTNFTTPVGRLLIGSLYKPQTTDAEGHPLVIKNGPNAGQPKVRYFFAVGFPKQPGETHWGQTPWGATVWKVGHEAFPAGQADSPTFSWKVVDGDSQVPNRAGKKPCDREGYPGNWVVSFSSGFAPEIYNKDGSSPIAEPDAVKLGYYVQVNADVDGNSSQQQPGVFINHSMVALSAYGPEIYLGPDATTAGFGAAALPAGAMSAPAPAFAPPARPAATTPPTFAPPAATFPPAPPANPAFLAVPVAPGAPVRVMLPAANGASYEQMLSAGWNDALLVAHSMMVG
jgi:hypothetical protein